MAIANTDVEAYALRIVLSVGTRIETIINESINEAVRRIAADVPSSRYDVTGVLSINGSEQSTASITNGSTSLARTSGNFASWADDGEVLLDGQWYAVSSGEGTGTLTLATAYVGDDISDGAYTLYQDAYSIADDAMEIGQDLFYGENWLWGQTPISYDELLRRKQYYTTGNDYSYAHALAGRKLYLYPFPNESRSLRYVYRKLPAAVASFGTSVDLDVDDAMETLLYRAVDVALKQRGVYRSTGTPNADYIEELKRFRRYNGGSRNFGPMRSGGSNLREQPRVSGLGFNWPS